MMPTVAVCVYCSQKIEEKEKSVNVPHLPGGVAHLACDQKVTIRVAGWGPQGEAACRPPASRGEGEPREQRLS